MTYTLKGTRDGAISIALSSLSLANRKDDMLQYKRDVALHESLRAFHYNYIFIIGHMRISVPFSSGRKRCDII